jgi:hypothetical protein
MTHDFDFIQKAEKILENISYGKERYEICKKCEKFNNLIKVCSECKCFMPVKAHFKESYCPIQKWGKAA